MVIDPMFFRFVHKNIFYHLGILEFFMLHCRIYCHIGRNKANIPMSLWSRYVARVGHVMTPAIIAVSHKAVNTSRVILSVSYKIKFILMKK
jgi:hypothetical protein